jgi:hypothetical protein
LERGNTFLGRAKSKMKRMRGRKKKGMKKKGKMRKGRHV